MEGARPAGGHRGAQPRRGLHAGAQQQWYRVFYDALQNKDQAVFWREIVRLLLDRRRLHRIAILRFYLTQLLQMRWRAWMTRNYLARWLADHTFYRLELARYAGRRRHAGQPRPAHPGRHAALHRLHHDAVDGPAQRGRSRW